MADNEDIYNSTTTIGVGAQIGYYMDLGGMIVIFGKAGAYFLMVSMDSSGSESSFSGFQITPEAGIALFLNNNAAIQISGIFNYSSISEDDSDISTQTIIYGAKIGAAIFL
jgi:nucleoside-specific outer membrane channel protein Tsx